MVGSIFPLKSEKMGCHLRFPTVGRDSKPTGILEKERKKERKRGGGDPAACLSVQARKRERDPGAHQHKPGNPAARLSAQARRTWCTRAGQVVLLPCRRAR